MIGIGNQLSSHMKLLAVLTVVASSEQVLNLFNFPIIKIPKSLNTSFIKVSKRVAGVDELISITGYQVLNRRCQV